MIKTIKNLKGVIFTNVSIGILILLLGFSRTPSKRYAILDEAYNSFGYNDFFYTLLILFLGYGGNAIIGGFLGIIAAKKTYPIDILGTVKQFIIYCASTLILVFCIYIQGYGWIIIGQQIVGYILGYGVYCIFKFVRKSIKDPT